MKDARLSWPACPMLPCAWGDAFDRLTILDLKCARISDTVQLKHISAERAAVAEALGDLDRFPPTLAGLVADLAAVNADLWDTENAIRACEAEERRDDRFVALARRVPRCNAVRARLKRDISLLLGSALIEQKHYGPST